MFKKGMKPRTVKIGKKLFLHENYMYQNDFSGKRPQQNKERKRPIDPLKRERFSASDPETESSFSPPHTVNEIPFYLYGNESHRTLKSLCVSSPRSMQHRIPLDPTGNGLRRKERENRENLLFLSPFLPLSFLLPSKHLSQSFISIEVGFPAFIA